MEFSIVKKAKEVLKEKKVRRRWMAAVAVLAVVVVGATAWAFMSPARAMIELYCDLEEHVHSDECYELVLTCGHEEESELGLEFKVDLLEEESDEYADAYAAVADYAENLDEESGVVLFKLLTYSLITADGEEVDLSECNVRADITPLVSGEDLKGAETESIAYGIEDDEEETGENEEVIATFSIIAFELSEKQANVAGSVILDEEDDTVLSVTLENGILPLAAIGTVQIGNANPKFMVQYYAWLDVVDQVTAGSGTLSVIDTSKNGDGTGGKLPRNVPMTGTDSNQSIIDIKLDSTKGNTVATTRTLTEVYRVKEPYQYVQKPSLK